MMNSLVYVDSDSPDVRTQLIEVKPPPIITFTCYYLLTDFWHIGVNQFFFLFCFFCQPVLGIEYFDMYNVG